MSANTSLPPGVASQGFNAARPLLETLPFPALWIGDDYELRWANPAAARRLRKQSGKCYECMHGYEAPCDVQPGQRCRSIQAVARQQTCEFVHIRQEEGGVELFKVVALPMDGGTLEFHIPIDDDFSRDALTGLLNRPATEHVVRQGLLLMRRLKQRCAVVILDLDRFKRINDGFGHAAGDAYLQAVGAILRRETRTTDLVGRWGGEEFLIFMPGCDRRGAETKIKRVLSAIRDLQVDFHGNKLHATASAGIWSGYARNDFQAIYEEADAALYLAKEEGRDRYCFADGNASFRTQKARESAEHRTFI